VKTTLTVQVFSTVPPKLVALNTTSRVTEYAAFDNVLKLTVPVIWVLLMVNVLAAADWLLPALSETEALIVAMPLGVVDWTVQLREELSPGFGVRHLLKPESLTPYQQSIIGALLAQRAGKR